MNSLPLFACSIPTGEKEVTLCENCDNVVLLVGFKLDEVLGSNAEKLSVIFVIKPWLSIRLQTSEIDLEAYLPTIMSESAMLRVMYSQINAFHCVCSLGSSFFNSITLSFNLLHFSSFGSIFELVKKPFSPTVSVNVESVELLNK